MALLRGTADHEYLMPAFFPSLPTHVSLYRCYSSQSQQVEGELTAGCGGRVVERLGGRSCESQSPAE